MIAESQHTMWLNSTAQTALRAVVYLCQRAPDHKVPVDEIAKAIGLPRNYLSKTLNALRRSGVLTASRGPGGGFGLARPANEITLADLIKPFVPVGGRRCLLGRKHCSDVDPCCAHAQWSRVVTATERFFNQTTVAALADHGNGGATPEG